MALINPFKPAQSTSLEKRSFWNKLHLDPILMLLLMLLCGFGLVVLYSASDKSLSMILRQLVYVGMGFLVMIVIAQIPPRFMCRWSVVLYILGIILLLLVLFLGHSAKGAQRWLNLPGLRFQPAEVMKLAMPLTVAWFLSRSNLPMNYRQLIVALILVFVPAAMILAQPDLGTALLIAASGFFVVFLAGLSFRLIALAFVAAIPAAWFMWEFVMHPYQRSRVLTFLDPERDPWGAGWNIIQSKVAIGSGGLEGKGWLLGTQSHLDFLPESHTDFIVAVLGEEFGMIGMLSVLVLYLAIVGRGLYMSSQSQSVFGRLVSGSIILAFFVYLFVNIGMVTGILPVVGVPLPMVSRGGTSIIILMAGFGVVMSAYTHRTFISRH